MFVIREGRRRSAHGAVKEQLCAPQSRLNTVALQAAYLSRRHIPEATVWADRPDGLCHIDKERAAVRAWCGYCGTRIAWPLGVIGAAGDLRRWDGRGCLQAPSPSLADSNVMAVRIVDLQSLLMRFAQLVQ
jgi:hypothetical protein